ncbi:hypothetical protein AADG42_03285 [Ammonicoccus fulvus]|uniref:Uncharacterized protein n=1 Tax=Ammonicoccus fulvus TaxID=3138240 RepID=A0ABZ3FMN5_9ACTN
MRSTKDFDTSFPTGEPFDRPVGLVTELDPTTRADALAPGASVPIAEGEASPESGAEEKEKEPFLGLKPTAVVGGALASVTAAMLGGQLGLAGTVAGAALTSVTIAVGGALYTRSMDKTRDGLGSVRARLKLGGTVPVTVATALKEADADDPTALFGAADKTRALPTAAIAAQGAKDKRWFSPFKILATAAAVFILAALVVTGFEAFTGKSVSGGEGTTVSQISRGEPATRTHTGPTEQQRQSDRDPSAAPTPEASASATTEPTTEPTTGATTAPTTGATTAPTTGASTQPTTRATTGSQPTTGATGGAGSGTGSGTSGGTGTSSGTGTSGGTGSSGSGTGTYGSSGTDTSAG